MAASLPSSVVPTGATHALVLTFDIHRALTHTHTAITVPGGMQVPLVAMDANVQGGRLVTCVDASGYVLVAGVARPQGQRERRKPVQVPGVTTGSGDANMSSVERGSVSAAASATATAAKEFCVSRPRYQPVLQESQHGISLDGRGRRGGPRAGGRPGTPAQLHSVGHLQLVGCQAAHRLCVLSGDASSTQRFAVVVCDQDWWLVDLSPCMV